MESIINAKQVNDENWKAQRQADRDNTVAIRDAGIVDVTSNPARYGQYLTLQGDNPTYSAGNIVLCMYQLDRASMIGTAEKWKSLGRYVLDTEKNKGAKIFVRPSSPKARGYSLGDAYDISQTQGRDVNVMRLEDNSPQMEKALATLLNYSPVPVTVDHSMEQPAYYDDGNMELVVNPDYPDGAEFAALGTEIALARLHDKGSNEYFDRNDNYLDADSVSYLLCRRFGVERNLPDTSGIAALNEGMTLESRTKALNAVQDMAKTIGRSIDIQINPPQRTQSRSVRAAR